MPPITREQLDNLRSLGVDTPYDLVQGDSLNPQGSDLFQNSNTGVSPYTFNTANNLLDAMRQQAGTAGQVPGDIPVSAYKKPTNILDTLRDQAGVQAQTPGDLPVPQEQKSSIPESVAKVAQKSSQTANKGPQRAPATIDDTSDEEDDSDDSSENKPYNSRAQLLAALSGSSANKNLADMLHAGTTIGSALARVKPDYASSEALAKGANQPLETYNALQGQTLKDQQIEKGLQEQRLLAGETDPDSEISHAVRDQLAKMGLKVSDQTSAKQLRDQGVDIGKLLTTQENAKARMVQSQLLNSYRQQQLDARQSLQDQRIHSQVIRDIDRNPNVKNRIQQIQNLDNAMAVLQAFPEGATPQQIADAQQLIVRNMGIQGQSGVGERAERYIHTAGMKGAGLLQFITGDPVMLSQNSKLMDYIRKQANTERDNANQQLLNTINMASAGHGSLYKRNPELLDDLKDKLTQYHDTMGNPVSGAAPSVGGNANTFQEGMIVTQKGHTYTFHNGKWE